MIQLLAILAIIAQATVALSILLWISEKAGLGRGFSWLRELVGNDALKLAALVAIIAMVGSLWLSEVKHYTPCSLCWYQRIAMYPLAIILTIAAALNDRKIVRYALPLAFIGGAISIFHYQLERFPNQKTVACDASVPCTTIWFQEFGYITIPMLALSAFGLIITLLWLGARHGKSV